MSPQGGEVDYNMGLLIDEMAEYNPRHVFSTKLEKSLEVNDSIFHSMALCNSHICHNRLDCAILNLISKVRF